MRVYVSCHTDKPTPRVPYGTLLHTGAIGKAHLAGWLRDDVGDTISARNPGFCELTALYWIWKNTTDDLVGLCHYRRFFSPVLFADPNRDGAAMPLDLAQRMLDADNAGRIFEAELGLAQMIVPVAMEKDGSIAAFFRHFHRAADWDAMLRSLADLHPDEAVEAERFFESRRAMHCYNMVIARRDVLNAYCDWLFPLLFHIESCIVPDADPYQARVFGFLAERLFNWWTASRGTVLVHRPVILVS